MGEESIRRPPASKNARMTSAQLSRASLSLPTLNVIQVPSPTRGKASPVEGTGLVRTGPGCAAPVRGHNIAVAPVAATAQRRLRRLRGYDGCIESSPDPIRQRLLYSGGLGHREP